MEPETNSDVAEPAGVAQCVGASPAGTRENVTLVTTVSYDPFGNPLTVTADDLPTAVPVSQSARTTTIAYGESNSTGTVVASNGRFPIQITNALNHIEKLQYDGRFGALLQVTDANNQVTKWLYDAFGRQDTELQHAHSPADIVRTDIYRAWCTAATCPNGGKLKALTLMDGAPPAAAETDRLGRTRATMQVGFDGKTVVSQVVYTNKGEVDKESRPYVHDAAPASIRWTDYGFDAISRVITEAVPSDAGTATTTTVYEPGMVDQYAFRVSTTNAAGQITREQSGEPRPNNSVDINWWMSAPSASGPTVTHTPQPGLVADDAGQSSGGAIAASTIAAQEQNWVAPTVGYQRVLVARAEGMVYEFSNWLDSVQTKLDFLSIGLDASIVGSSVSWMPDAANTGISAMRGDWLGAGLGVAAAIPYLGTTGNLTRIGIRQAHHVIPMFLGGIKRGDGVLSRITKEAHDGFHQILRARLQARGIDLPIGGVDGSTLAWADYFRANPGGQWNAFMAVLEASRLTDAAYGTTLVRDFWLGIAKGNYTSIP